MNFAWPIILIKKLSCPKPFFRIAFNTQAPTFLFNPGFLPSKDPCVAFRLSSGKPAAMSRFEVNDAQLLPPDAATEWLCLDCHLFSVVQVAKQRFIQQFSAAIHGVVPILAGEPNV